MLALAGLSLIALAAPAAATAAPPANDEPTAAEALPAGPFPVFSSTVNITDATTTGDPPLPSCQATVSRSVWFKFTPTQTGFYRLTTSAEGGTGTTVDDTVLAVYTSAGGAAGPFTEIPDGCDDDSATTENFQSTLFADLQAGTEYWVVAWKFGASAPAAGDTDLQLGIDEVDPATNDNVSTAADLTLNRPVTGNLGPARDDYRLTGAACFGGIGQTASTAPGHDVVYRFVASAAGLYSFRASFVVGSNPVVYVADSLPAVPPRPQNATDCLGASNRSSSISFGAEEVSPLPLAAGQEVFVVVDQHASSSAGGFTLVAERSVLEGEPNDSPATASSVPPPCGIRGAITPAADADFFSIGAPPANSRVFAMADGAAGSTNDFDARVTTATDTLEYDDAYNDIPFGNLAPALAGTPLTGSGSFLRLSAFSAGAQSEPYRLYWVVQPPAASAALESEPNDGLAAANTSALNYASGVINGNSDMDAFAFAVPARTLVLIGLDTDPLRDNSPFNGRITIFDPAGEVIDFANDAGTTSSTTSGAGTLTSTTPNSPGEGFVFRTSVAGTYSARVEPSGASVGGDYLLSIAPNCRPAATQPAISPAAVPSAVVGSAYSQSLTGTAGTAPYKFELQSGSLPAGISLATDGTLSGSASAAGSFTFSVLAVDAEDLTAQRQYTLTVERVQPAIATNASASVPAGGIVHDRATLSAGRAPSGTIEFALFGPNDADCSGPPVTTSTRNVNAGNGTYQSDDFSPSAPGTYRWIAGYAGDADNKPVSGACNDPGESVLVTAAVAAPRDTDAPETSIVKGPAKKTSKRKPKFEFQSSEAGTFECKLDKGAFEPCSSPEKTKKLAYGKHTFEVRATDAAGNTDPTPAKQKFKVKKKKKRR